MPIEADQILSVLDRCCDAFSFPMLDNGYFYLAATRLSLYRTPADWAIVFELFGYSPRAWEPSLFIETFANALCNRDVPEKYVKIQAYESYLANNPYNEFRAFNPIDGNEWMDDNGCVAEAATEFMLRGRQQPIPSLGEYEQRGITLEDPLRVQAFEFCRFIADVSRDSVLARADERRVSIPPGMTQILQLEEWHHPDVKVSEDRPSGSETFQQLAQVLVTGNVSLYQPSRAPNTHWKNWPEGGTL
jgi:hypothetical protein